MLGLPDPVLVNDMNHLPSPTLKFGTNEPAVTLPGEPLATHKGSSPFPTNGFQGLDPFREVSRLHVDFVTARAIPTELPAKIDIMKASRWNVFLK